jgi:hypothetical protein
MVSTGSTEAGSPGKRVSPSIESLILGGERRLLPTAVIYSKFIIMNPPKDWMCQLLSSPMRRRFGLWLHAGDDAPVTESWFHFDIRKARLLQHLGNLAARVLLSRHRFQHRNVHCGYREWAGAIIVQ